jgi:hypothetical protein
MQSVSINGVSAEQIMGGWVNTWLGFALLAFLRIQCIVCLVWVAFALGLLWHGMG